MGWDKIYLGWEKHEVTVWLVQTHKNHTTYAIKFKSFWPEFSDQNIWFIKSSERMWFMLGRALPYACKVNNSFVFLRGCERKSFHVESSLDKVEKASLVASMLKKRSFPLLFVFYSWDNNAQSTLFLAFLVYISLNTHTGHTCQLRPDTK